MKRLKCSVAHVRESPKLNYNDLWVATLYVWGVLILQTSINIGVAAKDDLFSCIVF